MASSSAGPRNAERSATLLARHEARASLWMLAVFAAWTMAFVGLSGRVAVLLGGAESGGEVAYLEAWAPWVAVTVVWLLPLLVGIGLALDARRRDRSAALARAALIVHTVVVVIAAGPAMLDRLLHLG